MKRWILTVLLLLALMFVLPVHAVEAVPGEDVPEEGGYTDGRADVSGENEASDEIADEPSADEPSADEPSVDEPSVDEDGSVSYSEVEAFVYDKIVPYAVLAISAMFTIYLLIAPILKRVMDASEKFKSATSGVTRANDDNAKTQEENVALLAQMKAERQEIVAAQQAYEKKMAGLMQSFLETVGAELGESGMRMREIRDMVCMGFCSDDKLVKRGVARQIARIAQGGETSVSVPDTGEDMSGESGEEVREDGEDDGQDEDGADA